MFTTVLTFFLFAFVLSLIYFAFEEEDYSDYDDLFNEDESESESEDDPIFSGWTDSGDPSYPPG